MGELKYEYVTLLPGTHFFEQGDRDSESYLEITEGELQIRRPIQDKPEQGGPTHSAKWTTVLGQHAKVFRHGKGRTFSFPPDKSPTVIFVNGKFTVQRQPTLL